MRDSVNLPIFTKRTQQVIITPSDDDLLGSLAHMNPQKPPSRPRNPFHTHTIQLR